MKAAFVATSDGTATRIASYVEAGTSVGLGGGRLAAGMASHKAWYSCDGTSVRLGGGRAACPPPGGLSAFCCWYISSAVMKAMFVRRCWGREDAKRYPKGAIYEFKETHYQEMVVVREKEGWSESVLKVFGTAEMADLNFREHESLRTTIFSAIARYPNKTTGRSKYEGNRDET